MSLTSYQAAPPRDLARLYGPLPHPTSSDFDNRIRFVATLSALCEGAFAERSVSTLQRARDTCQPEGWTPNKFFNGQS